MVDLLKHISQGTPLILIIFAVHIDNYEYNSTMYEYTNSNNSLKLFQQLNLLNQNQTKR